MMVFEIAQDFGGCIAGGIRCRKAGIGGRLYQCFLDLTDGETVPQADVRSLII
jgi:hypothetical protein